MQLVEKYYEYRYFWNHSSDENFSSCVVRIKSTLEIIRIVEKLCSFFAKTYNLKPYYFIQNVIFF